MRKKRSLILCVVFVLLLSACTKVQEKKEEEIPEPDVHEKLAKERMMNSEDLEVSDSEVVEFKSSEGAFKSLSFDSVEEVVQSLNDVYGYEQFKLTKEKLFSEENSVMMYVYTNKNKTFSVGVYDNDQVTFISVKGEKELCEKLKEFAKDLNNNTGFQYKDIENGCVLER